MIFTTKNKKFAIFGKTLTNLKEKWNKFKEDLIEKDGNLFGENGAFTSLFNGKKSDNILTPEVLKQFDEFKEKFNNSILSPEALAEQMKNVDQTIIDYAKTCKNGEMTTEGFKASIDNMSFSAKAGKAALQALSTAGNMLLFWGVSKAVEVSATAIDNYIHRVEKAKEVLSESVSAYQNTKSELSSINSELETQAKRMTELLAKDKLTYAETDELTKLRLITQELELQKALKEEETKRNAREVAQNAAAAYKTQFVDGTTDERIIQAAYNSLKNTGVDINVMSNSGDLGMQIAAYRVLQEEQKQALANQDENYQEFAANTQVVRDNLYSSLNTLTNLRDQMNAVPLEEMTDEERVIFESLQTNIRSLWEELDPNKWNEIQLSDVFHAEGIEKTKEDLIELSKAGKLDEETLRSYPKLTKAIADMDLFIGEEITNTQALIHWLKALGQEADSISETDSFPDFSASSLTEVVTALEEMAGKWKAIDELYSEFLEKGTGKFSNESMAGLAGAFREMEGVNMDGFLSVLSDSSSTSDDVQDAFDRLAAQYLYASGCLKGLTDATAEQVAKELEAQGVVNASAVVYSYLSAAKSYAASTGRDLANVSQEEILAFINEASASDTARIYLAQLELAKLAVNGTKIDTLSDIDQVISLANAAGASVRALSQLARAKAVYARAEADGFNGFDYDLNELEEAEKILSDVSSGKFNFEFKRLDAGQLKTPVYNGGTSSSARSGSGAASGSASGPASGSEREEKTQEIDWIKRKLELLQKEHDAVQEIARDETASYRERTSAVKDLIARDKERAEIAEKSAQKYQTAWKEAIKGLQASDIAKIINGDLDIGEYAGSYGDRLNEAVTAYDKMVDMEQQASDIQEEALNHLREQVKLQEEIIKAQQEEINGKLDMVKARMELVEAQGGVFNEGFYREQIALSRELSASYEDQIGNLQEQLDLVDRGSAEYYSLLASVNDCEKAILDCKVQQEEWDEAIRRLPLDRLQKYIHMLQNIRQDLQNFLDEQSVTGISVNKDQYQQLIDISEEEISKLLEQQQKLESLLSTYSYGSEKFNDTAKEIQEIDDRISSLIQGQLEYNDAILQIPAEKAQQLVEALDQVKSDMDNYMSEQKALGMDPDLDQYRQLNALSRERLNALSNQKEILTGLLAAYDQDSDKYRETVRKIQEVEKAISDTVQEQTQYNDALLKIPVEKIQKYLDVLDQARSDLDNYAAEQESLGQNIGLEQYQELNILTEEKLKALTNQKHILASILDIYDKDSEKYRETASWIQEVENAISGAVQEQNEWNQKILQLPIDRLSDANHILLGYSAVLEDVLKDYDQTLAAVNGALSQQVDILNELKDTAKKEYEEKIDPLQKQLDLLQKTNEQQKMQNALEQAAYDLDRAKNQKTTQVIRNGEKVYEADMEAVRNAKAARADAEYQKIVYDLQTEIENLEEQRDKLMEGYDEQIEKLDTIKNKWSGIADQIQFAADIQKADQIFGEGWESSLLSGNDETLYEMFKKLYTDTLDQKNQADETISSNERINEMMSQIVERYQSGEMSYQQAMDVAASLSASMKNGYSAAEQLQGLMGIDGIKDLSGIREAWEDKISGAVDMLAQYLGIVKKNDASASTSFHSFQKYLDAYQAGAGILDPYVSSWDGMEKSLMEQIHALQANAVTPGIFQSYFSAFLANGKAITNHASTWEEMQKNITDQMEALRKAAEALEKQMTQQASDNRPSSTSDNDTGTWSSSGPGSSGNIYVAAGPGHSQEELEKAIERGDIIVNYHSGIENGIVGKKQGAGRLKDLALRKLEPDESPVVVQRGEAILTYPQWNNILDNFDLLYSMPSVSGVPEMPQVINRNTQQSIDVHFGDIILPDVTKPDEFARELDLTFEASMRQNFSKVFKR